VSDFEEGLKTKLGFVLVSGLDAPKFQMYVSVLELCLLLVLDELLKLTNSGPQPKDLSIVKLAVGPANNLIIVCVESLQEAQFSTFKLTM
jgi:hypothetical protein